MKVLIYAVIFMMVIAQGFWAYTENYDTQKSLAETKRLQSEIANARSRLGVLNAEWAYLNRPDRLRDLVDMNYDRLLLLPLRPEQFGHVAEVPRNGVLASDFVERLTVSVLEVGE